MYRLSSLNKMSVTAQRRDTLVMTGILKNYLSKITPFVLGPYLRGSSSGLDDTFISYFALNQSRWIAAGVVKLVFSNMEKI